MSASSWSATRLMRASSHWGHQYGFLAPALEYSPVSRPQFSTQKRLIPSPPPPGFVGLCPAAPRRMPSAVVLATSHMSPPSLPPGPLRPDTLGAVSPQRSELDANPPPPAPSPRLRD